MTWFDKVSWRWRAAHFGVALAISLACDWSWVVAVGFYTAREALQARKLGWNAEHSKDVLAAYLGAAVGFTIRRFAT